MKTIKLTKIDRDQSDVLVNWDNVDFVTTTSNYFGDKYREIHCGKNSIDVKETLEEIENKIRTPEVREPDLL